ncbi:MULTISPECIES: PTS lactose/cellobiose transporter subunit IIA [unclassified Enterococcus]|uniref:PTS lactose/cellobiose transporter subunit IIA n=1 Tax=unclassified Enterococcus TaxID=2608891 RepID=UPI001CE15051|nr:MULTISPECIES: PTS lactose/cellobiose transporter subunit IIA [unclassified Enterococcus]MCA5013316.1 PTS lactose/cellobiose transporter subunit IIA [Enterococcus sp. S23]MCA5016566.1 PTS lactose/cellobiose transporter subunit IIA [Enterococcus sp. S22(2020)]
MDGLELVAFNIISTVGTAKSKLMESMSCSRNGQFAEAETLINEANEALQAGEKEHFTVITKEAKYKTSELTLLFIHAEDQLMTTVVLRDLANELLEMNKSFYELKQKVEELEKK